MVRGDELDDEQLPLVVEPKVLVISANRTAEEANSVPAMMSIITAQEIAESGKVSLPEILEEIAGVRFYGGAYGPGSESISMRGFGENSHGRVLVLLDGNKINSPDMQGFNWNVVPLADIERIEVMDGSGSVQYGNYAVGGVINIITKKSGAAKTSVSVLAGSFYQNSESFSFQRPGDWGYFSVSAGHSGTQGSRRHQASDTANTAIDGTLNIQKNMFLDMRGSFVTMNYQFPGYLTQKQFDDDPSQAQNTRVFSDGGFEYDISGGVNLRWMPADNIEVFFPLSYIWKNTESDSSGAMSMSYGSLVHTAGFRPQLKVSFDIAKMPARILCGIDLYYAHTDKNSYETITRTGNPFKTNVSLWTLGPFISARLDPFTSLNLDAGLRWDSAYQSSEKNKPQTEKQYKQFKTLVYEFAVVYRPVDQLKIYAKYSTTFRYPFTDELTSWYGTAYDSYVSDLAPEKGFNLEGGIGFRLGDWVDINGNVYYMKTEDEIAYDNTKNMNSNMDTTQRIGTNISLRTLILRRFDLQCSYSYVDAVFINGVNEGKHIPLVSAHAFYGGLLVKTKSGFSFGPDIEYRGARPFGSDYANAAKDMEAYVLIGLKARYVFEKEGKQYLIQLSIKNIADVKYATYGFYTPDYGSGETFTYYPNADMGRSFTISLRCGF